MTRKYTVGRRRLLKGAGVATLGTVVGAPTIWAQNNKNIVLRQFGTGVSNVNAPLASHPVHLWRGLNVTSDAASRRTQRTPLNEPGPRPTPRGARSHRTSFPPGAPTRPVGPARPRP